MKSLIVIMVLAVSLIGCKASEFKMTKHGCKSMATGKFVNKGLCK